MYGLTLEEASGSPLDIWPDNAKALRVFIAMLTQWRYDFSGRTGLDYSALPEVWERTHIKPRHRDDVFDCLRVMEDAALECIREQQKKANR